MSTVLEGRSLFAGYHSHPVVEGINLRVAAGEVVALLGPNGAGKTTTMLTLAGELRPLSGEILLDDKMTAAPLHVLARKGLSFVSEERAIFGNLTTAENLRVGRVDAGYVLELFPELRPLLRRKAGLLSGGEQQMLALGRALGRRPRILLADELSLGLAPLVVTRLLQAVRRAADEDGVGVLLVEQHVKQILRIADRVYVMRRGRIVLEGTVADVSGRLEDAYLADEIEPADDPETTGAV